MEVTFAPHKLEINNARITCRNFKGEEGRYNREGDRSFLLVIAGGTLDDDKSIRNVSAEEMADALKSDVNRMGVGWNVKIKMPKEDGDEPFMYLPVKVKFNDYGPRVYLKSGVHTTQLDEESVGSLDGIEIRNVDLDIRPYDDEIHGKPFRSAYLQGMCVTQEIDRFAARLAEEECPEE